MPALILRDATAVYPDRVEAGVDVYIEGETIAGVGPSLKAKGAEVLDARGFLLAPGFVDLHIHGAAGAMCEQGDPGAVSRISATLSQFGVTGFLPTVATLPPEQLRAAVEAIAAVAGQEPGARILGIHLEGPYLSPVRAGAQAIQWMRAPSIEEIDVLQELSGGRIRLITVAPEVEGAISFIAAVRQRGIKVALGHSNATTEEMQRGIGAGGSHVTHLFNAMRELHHREPGIIGVALTDDSVSVELICDGHHLDPRVIDLALRCKPPDKVVLVSDAVGALGMPDGDYEMFGFTCTIAGGTVRLKQGGSLAGSCLSLDHAVRNVRDWVSRLPIERVIAAASTNPALVLGDPEVGVIGEGKAGDLVLLDSALGVAATICRGSVVWRRPVSHMA